MGEAELIRESGLRVAVLCGGSGSEREVSLVSGRAVAKAFEETGIPCDLFELPGNRLPELLSVENHLVLPLVHGTYGEDGRLSAELEAGGFAYGGCDQAASVLCFDKLASKAIARHLDIPVAKDCLLAPGRAPAHEELVRQLGQTCILKPRRDGSSVGLHHVPDAKTYDALRADLLATDYVAEAFIGGTDLTVGILGEEALGVGAIYPEGGLYDYAHKYTKGMSRYTFPADIGEPLTEQLRDWSLRIYRACGCRDLARVDFRLSGEGAAFFLEINTLPGMTPTSLLPKSALCKGISFEQLCCRWASFALARKEGVAA